MNCKNPTACCPACEKVERVWKGPDKQYRFFDHEDERGACPGSRKTVEEATRETIAVLFDEVALLAAGSFA